MRKVHFKTIAAAGFLILGALAFGWFGVQPTFDFLPTAKPAVESVGTFQVVRVVDGDTVVLDIDGTHDSVRLVGIDAPEMNWETDDPECFAWEARNRADELLDGKNVVFERDFSQDERDAHGRLLGYILVNGTDVAETLLREGYGREFTFKEAYAKQDIFRAAQAHARANKIGLFASGTCLVHSE